MLPAIPPSLVYVTPVQPRDMPLPPPLVSPRGGPEVLRSPHAAPVVAPAGVAPETGIESAMPEPAGRALDQGTVIGVEGGLPVGPVMPPPVPAPPEPPKRVGGDVVAPTRIFYVSPVYPPMAIAARVEGVVIIEATISENGSVEDARVLRSVPLLDAAALDAVRQWRYTPTLLNGVPVRIIMTVTVRFTLKNEV
jgi:protein TonB